MYSLKVAENLNELCRVKSQYMFGCHPSSKKGNADPTIHCLINKPCSCHVESTKPCLKQNGTQQIRVHHC